MCSLFYANYVSIKLFKKKDEIDLYEPIHAHTEGCP